MDGRKESISQSLSREVKEDFSDEEPDFSMPSFMITDNYNSKDHSWCCSGNPKKIVPPSAKSDSSYKLHAVENGIYATCGIHEGLRPYMEDRHRIISARDGHRGFFGIFDGHGGSESPQYAAQYLYEDLIYQVDKSLRSKHNGKIPEKYDEEDPDQIIDALAEGSMSCEVQMLDSARTYAFTSGCTAISVMVRGNRLYCINVGDSRAVMCRAQGAVLELSKDHKPSDPREADRIRDSGGEVGRLERPVAVFCCFGEKSEPYGAVRVWPGGLSVSRTMGDVVFKDPNLGKTDSDKILVATPEITSVEIQHDDEFIILGTDGLWDVFSSLDAVKFVYKKRNSKKFSADNIAKRLADRAYSYGSTDNITIVILFFTHHQDTWERTPCRSEGCYIRGEYEPMPRPPMLRIPSAPVHAHTVADFAPYKETPKADSVLSQAIELTDLQNPIELSKRRPSAVAESPNSSGTHSPNKSPSIVPALITNEDSISGLVLTDSEQSTTQPQISIKKDGYEAVNCDSDGERTPVSVEERKSLEVKIPDEKEHSRSESSKIFSSLPSPLNNLTPDQKNLYVEDANSVSNSRPSSRRSSYHKVSGDDRDDFLERTTDDPLEISKHGGEEEEKSNGDGSE